MFTDTHCHLSEEYFDDFESVINAALAKNVNRIITNGCNRQENAEVLKTIQCFSHVYGALGIHPHEARSVKEEDYEFIKNNLGNPKILAIGEIGLDYHYDLDFKTAQIECFRKLLKIAEDTGIPVVIHSREAFADTYNILKEYKVKGVIHSFSGTLQEAERYIALGFLIGINGIVTFKNGETLRAVVKNIPLENIVLETDAPYLAPEPFRGQKNTPENVIEVAKKVAEVKEISLEKLAQITNDNIARIFDI